MILFSHRQIIHENWKHKHSTSTKFVLVFSWCSFTLNFQLVSHLLTVSHTSNIVSLFIWLLFIMQQLMDRLCCQQKLTLNGTRAERLMCEAWLRTLKFYSNDSRLALSFNRNTMNYVHRRHCLFRSILCH